MNTGQAFFRPQFLVLPASICPPTLSSLLLPSLPLLASHWAQRCTSYSRTHTCPSLPSQCMFWAPQGNCKPCADKGTSHLFAHTRPGPAPLGQEHCLPGGVLSSHRLCCPGRGVAGQGGGTGWGRPSFYPAALSHSLSPHQCSWALALCMRVKRPQQGPAECSSH